MNNEKPAWFVATLSEILNFLFENIHFIETILSVHLRASYLVITIVIFVGYRLDFGYTYLEIHIVTELGFGYM